MPRCSGCGSGCGCVIIAGDNVTIDGAGTPESPYVVNAAGGGGGSAISGEVKLYAGADTPAGWLTADGSAVSRTTYSTLFGVIGSTYGPGDGSTTFNLPDLAGRFPLGVDSGHPRGQVGGLEQVTITTADLPAHAHAMPHRHNATHIHDISHDHADATSTANGNHHHTFTVSKDPGNNNNTVARGSQNDLTENTSTDGSHQHSVDIPPFSGGTGLPYPTSATDLPDVGVTAAVGSGNPLGIMPPFTAIRFLIKT